MPFRTQIQVDRLRLPAGKLEHVETDGECPGLGVRLQGDARTWIVRCTLPDGTRRRVTLGPVAGLPLVEARKQAARIVVAARDGVDPVRERARKRQEAAESFLALAEAFMVRYAAREQKASTQRETKRALMVYALPLHAVPAAAVTRRDVATLLESVATASGLTTANRVRAALSKLYAWGMAVGLVEGNPVIGTARPAPETKRDRVLSMRELAAVWRAVGEDDFGRIVRLLILTGQRREEVAAMAEGEIDRATGLWCLPPARTKNGRPHDLILPPEALALLPPPRPGRDNLFGRGARPFSGWSKSKAALDVKLPALPAWTLHDLRRSFATHAAEFGVQPHVVEAVLNHISGHRAGVAGTYNRATYSAEKRAALTAWAAKMAEAVATE
jgi:integrase